MRQLAWNERRHHKATGHHSLAPPLLDSAFSSLPQRSGRTLPPPRGAAVTRCSLGTPAAVLAPAAAVEPLAARPGPAGAGADALRITIGGSPTLLSVSGRRSGS